jgi:hypothetical protein
MSPGNPNNPDTLKSAWAANQDNQDTYARGGCDKYAQARAMQAQAL